MRINLVNVVMFGIGAILLYSGIMGYDPRDVVKWGLGGKRPKKVYGFEAKLILPKQSGESQESKPAPKPVLPWA